MEGVRLKDYIELILVCIILLILVCEFDKALKEEYRVYIAFLVFCSFRGGALVERITS